MMMMFCFNDVKLKSIDGRGLQKYDQWKIKLASNYFSDNFFQVSNNVIFQSPYIWHFSCHGNQYWYLHYIRAVCCGN